MTAKIELGADADFKDAQKQLSDVDKALLKLIQSEKRLAAENEAKAKFDAMSDAEKEAMLQANALAKSQENLGEKVEDSGDKAKAGAGGFDNLGKAVVVVNQAMEVAQKAWDAFNKVSDATIGKVIDLADKQRDLERITGATADQTGRLIQFADDVKVGYDTLTQAAKALANDGLTLTIEQLQKNSDEYLKLSTAGEKAEYADKKFGRSAQELTKILELGSGKIKEMSESIGDNLILTEEQIKQAREMEIAQDGLNDSIDGLSMAFGKKLLPAVTSVIKEMNKGVDTLNLLAEWEEKTKKIAADHADQVLRESKEYNDYAYEIQRVNFLMQGRVMSTQQIIDLYKAEGWEIEKDIVALGGYSKANFEAEQHIAQVKKALEGLTGSQKGVNTELDQYKAKQDAATASTKLATAELAAADAAGKSLLENSMKPLTKEILFQTLAKGLDAEATKILARQFGLLDEATYSAMTAAEKLTADFIAGKISATDYFNATEALKGSIAGMKDKTVNITVNTNYVQHGSEGPGAPLPPGPDDTTPTDPDKPRAMGGPVSAGETYLVGEQGPERLVMGNNNGQIVPNAGGIDYERLGEVISRKMAQELPKFL
jgi:hypothetical protein